MSIPHYGYNVGALAGVCGLRVTPVFDWKRSLFTEEVCGLFPGGIGYSVKGGIPDVSVSAVISSVLVVYERKGECGEPDQDISSCVLNYVNVHDPEEVLVGYGGVRKSQVGTDLIDFSFDMDATDLDIPAVKVPPNRW